MYRQICEGDELTVRATAKDFLVVRLEGSGDCAACAASSQAVAASTTNADDFQTMVDATTEDFSAVRQKGAQTNNK